MKVRKQVTIKASNDKTIEGSSLYGENYLIIFTDNTFILLQAKISYDITYR
jgi:hypothetical protein